MSLQMALPVDLCLSGVRLMLQRLKFSQVTAAYNLLCAEAKSGGNVGLDEFPTEESLLSHVTHGASFALTDSRGGALRSLLTVSPSVYCRSVQPFLADCLVVCDDPMKQHLYQELIQLAMHITARLGYRAIITDVFAATGLSQRLYEQGFTVIGCIPRSGKTANNGWTDSLIMLRELDDYFTDKRQESRHIVDMVEPVSASLGKEDQAGCPPGGQSRHQDCIPTRPFPGPPNLPHFKPRPRLTHLPYSYTMATGHRVRVRYQDERDIPRVHALYRAAAEQNDGYASEEFSTVEAFRYNMVDHGHPFLVEDTLDDRFVAALTVLPAAACRSSDPALGDPAVLIDRRYQGMGIGNELSKLIIDLSRRLGYAAILADVFTDNTPARRALQTHGFTVISHLPCAARDRSADSRKAIVLYYKDIREQEPTHSKL